MDDAAWLAREEALRPLVKLDDDLPMPPRTLGGFDVAYQGGLGGRRDRRAGLAGGGAGER